MSALLKVGGSVDNMRPAYLSVSDRMCMEMGQQYGCMRVFLKMWSLIQNDCSRYKQNEFSECHSMLVL